ncbi:MAG: hypothetical protein ACPG4U_05465 [Pseudomonadales bacterium]
MQQTQGTTSSTAPPSSPFAPESPITVVAAQTPFDATQVNYPSYAMSDIALDVSLPPTAQAGHIALILITKPDGRHNFIKHPVTEQDLELGHFNTQMPVAQLLNYAGRYIDGDYQLHLSLIDHSGTDIDYPGETAFTLHTQVASQIFYAEPPAQAPAEQAALEHLYLDDILETPHSDVLSANGSALCSTLDNSLQDHLNLVERLLEPPATDPS